MKDAHDLIVSLTNPPNSELVLTFPGLRIFFLIRTRARITMRTANINMYSICQIEKQVLEQHSIVKIAIKEGICFIVIGHQVQKGVGKKLEKMRFISRRSKISTEKKTATKNLTGTI